MRKGSGASWEIREGLDHGLALVLYVRDSVYPQPLPDLSHDVGPLEPAVVPEPGDAHEHGHEVAVQELARWWTRALEHTMKRPLLPGSPGWEGMDDLPAARRSAERLHDDFWEWLRPQKALEVGHARTEGLQLTRFVNGLDAELGRPVRPFRLHVRVIPVGGVTGWVVAEDQVLVTPKLRDDTTAFIGFLRPVVSALA